MRRAVQAEAVNVNGRDEAVDFIAYRHGRRHVRRHFPTEVNAMPGKETAHPAAKDKREGKSASTQAGEYVHEEIEHVREGKHGARSAKQAIAIGLSKARRAGVDVPPPRKSRASEATREKAEHDSEAAGKHKPVSKTRSRATTQALKREGSAAASKTALSRQTHAAAKKRTASERSAAAKKAAKTRGASGRSAAAKKAAHTREVRAHH
jgi:hypothetical protein